MSNYIFYLITLSVIGSLDFLLIYFVHKFNKNISNRFIYLLLKLVLLYLLVPIIFLVYTFRQLNSVQELAVYGEDFNSAIILKNLSIDIIFKRNKTIQTFYFILLILWLIGFIYMFGYKVLTTYYRLNQLQEISIKYNNNSTEILISDILNKPHIARSIEIYKTHGIGSPFIVGIKKVKIFLPDMLLSPREIELIMRHEMIHYKKGDVLFKNLMLLLQAIYWFNPFVYLFKNYFIEMCELACDEEVLYKEPKDVRYEYGRLIIGMLEKQSKSYHLVFFSDYNDKRIRRRIKDIMLQNKKHSHVLAIFLSAICIFAFPITSFGVTMGAVSLENQISRNIMNHSTVYEVYNDTYDEDESTYYIDKTTLLYKSGPGMARGSNLVDCTLNGNESYLIDDLYLSQGSTVQFILASSDNSHKFKAGILDSKGTFRAVNSSKGMISYTFKITSAGDYSLLIEGITNAEIHISGSIVVK